MKKTIKTMLAFVAGVLCLTGCDKENMNEETSNARLVTLTAYQEDEGVTKAAIDGTTSTQINWSTGDKINYFGSAGAKDESMTLLSGENTPSGIFQGTVTTGTTDYVLYPYQASATCTADLITAEVPMTQYAVANSFDPAAALMVGRVSGSSVQFKNVMSYVKVTIPSDMTTCKQVAIKAQDAWTTVAGKVNINANTGEWAETSAKEGEAFVRLVPKSGNYLTAGASYYIAILPQTMTTGFELIFNDNDVIKVKQSASDEVIFDRSKTKKLGAITSYNYEVSAVQLTSDLKVADRNIGAASSTAYGDYFAWAARRPTYITKNATSITLAYKSGGFKKDNTPYYNGSAYTKYTTAGDLDKEDDIAAMLWGGKWRMPTKTQLDALVELKDGTGNWDSGWSFKGKGSYSSNSVSLPGAGYFGTVFEKSNYNLGYYWSSTHDAGDEGFVQCLCFGLEYVEVKNDLRSVGTSVRAVLAE